VTLLRKNIYRYSYARKVTPERLLATEVADSFNHILKNFYAFEILMAPYAIGHLKISLLLPEEIKCRLIRPG